MAGMPGEPSADQLARHFPLDDADRELAGTKRWDHMRLGFAVQLGTVRFLGTFLDEPAAVPGGVAGHVAQQLGIPDAGCLTRYATARGRWLHSAEIKERHGYREFTDPAARFPLARWLYALCWTGTDRPSALFDRATMWLVTKKVLLPGASALERLVSSHSHAGRPPPLADARPQRDARTAGAAWCLIGCRRRRPTQPTRPSA